MAAYYNEFDPAAARWLRELMHEGHIPAGDVDERSIRDVSADDLRGYVQCHFFAGIGVWPYALRRAGWDDDRPVGTGSCPCQPFSAAGKGLGFNDPRHLWPDFRRIIRGARQYGQRWADCILGEQAATAGAWIDLVRSDLEALGYAFGSPDLPAAGFGGAHIRQRLYWVADADNTERWTDLAPRHIGDWPDAGRVEGPGDIAECGAPGGLAHVSGLGRRQEHSDAGGLSAGDRSEGWAAGPSAGFGDCDWIYCRDEQWRPVEAGTFPLAPTSPARLGLLRGYGNSLDGETAANFVGAYMEAAGINSAAIQSRAAA